jgi:hypothetical protein
MARVRAGLRIVALTQQLRRTVEELKVAGAELDSSRAEVHRLAGLLPICSHCNKVRAADGEWQEIAVYLGSRDQASFTQGVCPECRSSQPA